MNKWGKIRARAGFGISSSQVASHRANPAHALHLEEIRPSVQRAGRWHFRTNYGHAYPLENFQFMLMERGRIDVVVGRDRFSVSAGELVCFRPCRRPMSYVSVRGTRFIYAAVRFAPPP